jgi:hypothetical protein
VYLPNYNRGESITGYVSRCSSTADMVRNVGQIGVRQSICKEHAEQMRKALRQPFTESERKLGQKKP